VPDCLAQLDPEAIDAIKAVAMAFPTAAGMLAVIWINERRSERREKRVEAAAVLREQVWVDVAKQNNRVATDGHRLQEKTLEVVKEASQSFGQASQMCGQMDTARQEFQRKSG